MYDLKILEIIQILGCQRMQYKVMVGVNMFQRGSGRLVEAGQQRSCQKSRGQGSCTTSFRPEPEITAHF